MKSLIIGGRGLVGSALKHQIPDALIGINVEPKESNQVYTDITKYETLFKVFKNHRPQIVYLPAAITNVDKCESQSTDIVNIRGATTVLRLCESFESKLVYFSSSYVFDGNKKEPYSVLDETKPLNNYGQQKLAMENLMLQSDAKCLIVRTVGVYGVERTKKNFAKQVISAIFSGKSVYAADDQYMNPILSSDLARLVVRLSQKHAGLWHVAGDTCLTKYEFARKIAGYFGLESMIKSVTSDDMNQKAMRPKNGCLDCSDLITAGFNIPNFDAGLARFLSLEYNG